jgi:hypothetical protein
VGLVARLHNSSFVQIDNVRLTGGKIMATLSDNSVRLNNERPVILGNAFAMKRWIAITILWLVPALASAEPITTGNYLRYSYRDHYRAYGIKLANRRHATG